MLDITKAYWGQGAVRLTIYVDSDVDLVLDDFIRYCGCSPSPQNLDRIRFEFGVPNHFTSTADWALLMVVGPSYRATSKSLLTSMVTHDLFHAMHRGLGVGGSDPTWMAEGGAEYAMVRVQASAGMLDSAERDRLVKVEAASLASKLTDLEYSNDGGPAGRAPYALGSLAVKLLVTNHGGEGALLRYWLNVGDNRRRGMPRDAVWRDAFLRSFGVDVEAFYDEFETYRTRGFE